MIELSLQEITDAVSGELVVGDSQTKVSGSVSTDSRELAQGDIFFAKLGANDDGHNYLDDLAAKGISLAVVSTPRLDLRINQILVQDTVAALAKLAEFVLNRLRPGGLKVIGITGSNGKTSTKSMLATMLASVAPTLSPQGSYNNLVGLPLTVLRLTPEHKYLVLEYGAAGVGSISALSSWSKPDIAAILKVGLAHAGQWGGIEVTAKIKAELAADAQSAVVLNADDPIVSGYQIPSRCKRLSFGFDGESVRVISAELSLLGTRVELEVSGTRLTANLKILGEHHAMNLAAALTIAAELGLDPKDAISSVEELSYPERWRMQLTHTEGDYFVINDAYNASPDSMRAALQTLATLGRQGHRTIAVLGFMAELGSISNVEHDQIGRLVVRYNIDKLFAVGEGAKLIHMGAMQEGSWDGESEYHESISTAFDAIREKLRPGDVVLVKASNSTGLRFLGDDLAATR